ncbi:histone-lysine N-methyltransferase SETMAR [Trichonephila clavipes]|nr:histone-lysine N-methyltransferase SETMAR [Trichonephila clavipes]
MNRLITLPRRPEIPLIFPIAVADAVARRKLTSHPVQKHFIPDLNCNHVTSTIIAKKAYHDGEKSLDEAWLYYYDPTIKQQSSEWKHPSSPTPKKAKTVNMAGIKRKCSLLLNGFLLHHDNARPHISRCVLDVSQQINIEILPHPPYSLDLTPRDFWLFPQLKKPLRGPRLMPIIKTPTPGREEKRPLAANSPGVVGGWTGKRDSGFQENVLWFPAK